MTPQVRTLNCFLSSFHSRIDPPTNNNGKQKKVSDSFSIPILLINSVGLCLSVSLILPVTGISGELRDTRLPSERQFVPQTSLPREKAPSVYDQFRKDIKDLTPTERDKVKNSFKAKIQDPGVKDNKEKLEYYNALIAILDEK